MRARWIALFLVAAVGGLAVADVSPGEVRSVQARSGTVLREAGKPLAKSVASLPYGTRVRVLAVAAGYAQVRTDEGQEGWVRSTSIVAPSALTGGGAQGPPTGDGRQFNVASSDVSAAGRQFDEGTEGRYRASGPELERGYRLVDELQGKGPRPDSPEVEQFIVEGRLGRSRP